MSVQEKEGMGLPISPFLENTNIQYAWDATSIETLKRCPQLYKYTMIDGYQPEEESVHLRFGAEMHEAFKEYEVMKAAGNDHETCLFHVVKNLLIRIEDWDPDHKYKNKPFLLRTVIRYLDQYKDDPAETVILSDGRPAVEVSFNFELDFGPNDDQPYVLCGHLDKVVNFNGEVFFMDHKSTTITPGDYYWAQFHPHTQMSLYTFACKVIFQTKIKGGIINAAQIMMDDTRFTRGFTYRTDDELTEWVEDLKDWLNIARYYAETDHWPKNDTACDKYGGCKFREICSKSPSVRGKFLNSGFKKGEPWNPLIPR